MKKPFVTSLALAIALGTLSACSSGGGAPEPSKPSGGSPSSSPKTPAAPAAPEVALSLKTLRGQGPDLEAQPVKVVALGGTITSVEVSGPEEKRVKVEEEAPGEWLLSGRLVPGKKYQVAVEGKNSEEKATKKTFPLQAAKPAKVAAPTIYPGDTALVGVGMPITVDFKKKVTDKKRVEALMKVTTTPATQGSWGWLAYDTTAVWRPHSFWEPGTKVSVDVPLKDASLGGGLYSKQGVTTEFSVAKRVLTMEISDSTKQLQVKEDGKLLKTMPVSLGKPGKRTSSGYNIIYEKGNPVRMRGEDYNLLVNYAQRYNTTGEYIHSAPWSVGDQGRRNVSHGCVNLSPANAKWLYGKTLMGDVVKITGTGRQAATWDGMGAIWNIKLPEWRAMSALS